MKKKIIFSGSQSHLIKNNSSIFLTYLKTSICNSLHMRSETNKISIFNLYKRWFYVLKDCFLLI